MSIVRAEEPVGYSETLVKYYQAAQHHIPENCILHSHDRDNLKSDPMQHFHFQTSINTDIENLPINFALLQLVGASVPETEGGGSIKHLTKEDLKNYLQAKKCIEELALYLKPFSSGE